MSIYKDLDFNFNRHPLTGDLSIKLDSQAIKQSLKNLIRTRIYERGFNVDIYSSVENLLFENMTPIMKHQLQTEIEDVINNFEPRVTLIDVEVFQKENYEAVVTVLYKVLNKDTPEQLDFVLEKVT